MQHNTITLLVVATLVAGAAAARSATSLRNGRTDASESFRASAHNAALVPDFWTIVNNGMPLMPKPEPFPSEYNLMPQRCPTGLLRVGCIYDTQMEQRRWYEDHIPKEDRVPMTPDLCFAFCKNTSGAQYFGLLRGDRCYCTPFFHDMGKGGNGDCDMPCVGDASRMCGGMEKADIYSMHDCNNIGTLYCPHPPTPENTLTFSAGDGNLTTPCRNRQNSSLSTQESFCEIVCKPGYELLKNDIECVRKGNIFKAWGEVEGNATCAPVNCGMAPFVANATYPQIQVIYPNNASYKCDTGFAVDALDSGNKSFTVSCTSDGFLGLQDCHRVNCGVCPEHPHAAPMEQGARVYEDQCNYVCNTGHTLDQTASGASTYRVTCEANGNWTTGAPACKPVSCGTPPAMTHSSVQSASGNVTYQAVVKYQCNTGYTITGQAAGSMNFERQCQANGLFSAHNGCKPVECGLAPAVQHSTYEANRTFVFNETVVYACDRGHSLDGNASSSNRADITCGAEGLFEGEVPQCLPVECGVPPAEQNAEVLGSAAEQVVVYPSSVDYACLEGHTLTSAIGGPGDFTRTCQANGSFTKAKTCEPVNCGNPPHVPNSTYPTANATFSDKVLYSCDKGFSTDGTATGSKEFKVSCLADGFSQAERCLPILCGPCPEGSGPFKFAVASERGDRAFPDTCSYKCKTGYTLDENADGPKSFKTSCLASGNFSSPDVCVPVSCGPADNLNYTSIVGTAGTLYPEQTKYTCDTGYTLTGQAGGATKFERQCQANGTYSVVQRCQPVTCGRPLRVPNSTYNPDERVYGESVTYSCDYGHTLDGTPGGEKESTLPCGANGNFEGTLPTCHPCSCGVPVDPANAEVRGLVADTEVVFPNSVKLECDAGHTLSGEIGGPDNYKRTCQSNGKFSKPKRTCKPVSCGRPPVVLHSQYPNKNATYGQDVPYACDTGFTVSAAPRGPAAFNVTCEENGFEPAKSCKRVVCGTCPKQKHATVMEAGERVFEDKCRYRCSEGYTAGTGDFNTSCLASGNFSKPGSCKPVKCGTPLVPDHTSLTASASHYPEVASFECHQGYSLTGVVGGPTRYEQRCQANATYSPGEQCKPVTCGEPATVADANYTKHARVYKEKVTYTCSTGYTLDGLAMGTRKATMTCGADGSFKEPAPACLPVKCGVPPDVPHADRLRGRESGIEAVFPDNVPFECHDGYTLTGADGGAYRFDLACRADGTFSPPPECKPINCGPPPSVHRSTRPDGNVFFPDNITYKCDRGHTVDAVASGSRDFSITCQPGGFTPVQSCLPVQCGKCPDGGEHHAVSGTKGGRVYEDQCSYKCKKGHTLDAKSTGPVTFNTSCLDNGTFSQSPSCVPVVCGGPPNVDNAKMEGKTRSLVYSEVVKYKCLKGYTVTGKAGAIAEFEQKCLATGTFSPPQQCKPVECGEPPFVKRAAFKKKTLKYNESVTYMCAPGHTMNGSATAPDKAVLTCSADGTFKGPEVKCVAVVCGIASPARNAKVVDPATNVSVSFPQKAKYKCEAGYTLDGHLEGDITFERKCQGTGKFAAGGACKPVVCGFPPKVPDSVYSNVTVTYPGNLTYTCDKGHTLDEMADGPKQFTVKCGPGGFGTAQSCKKIVCGVCPHDATGNSHAVPASTDEELRRYMDACSYTCATGYSLDRNASGPKSFNITCLANGSFSGQSTCLPVSCGKPSSVAHASLAGSSGISEFSYPEKAKYECDTGYTLTGFAGAPTQFERKCRADSTYSAAKKCKPVACGKPKPVQHATNDPRELVYNESVTHTCQSGYTLSGVAGTETKASMTCGADGSFRGQQPRCLPVKCGAPQSHDNANQTGSATSVAYPNSVEYECHEGYSTTGVADGPRRFTQDCQSNGTFSSAETCEPCLCGPTPQVADATFDIASVGKKLTYSEKVKYKCKKGHTVTGKAKGAKEFTVTCGPKGKMSKVEKCQKVKCGTCPAASRLMPHARPVKASIKASMRYFGDTCTYQCESGYTLDGEASGSSSYTTTCLETGEFTEASTCQPVVCGVPEAVDNANVESVGSISYPSSATYKCASGYTLTGKKNGKTKFERACQADGAFAAAPQCKRVPVECGIAPELPDAALVEDRGMELITDESAPLVYECLGGFSTKANDDPWTPAHAFFNLSCQSDGTYSEASACVNIDDCAHHDCGEMGKCEDLPHPHGEPEKDYRCVCHPGFEVVKVKSSSHPNEKEQVCQNIGDCPTKDPCGGTNKKGELRGECHDDIQSYGCMCNHGYNLTTLIGKPNNETCTPMSCGLVPDLGNGTHTPVHNVEATYDTPEWTYTCNKGYTLTGKAGDSKSYPMKCQASGLLTTMQKCLPVSCGAPPQVNHSTMSPMLSELVYPQQVIYTCKMGYSVGGTFDSPLEFTVSCNADGSLTGLDTCDLEADGWGEDFPMEGDDWTGEDFPVEGADHALYEKKRANLHANGRRHLRQGRA